MQRAEYLIRHYHMTLLRIENTYISEDYKSAARSADGRPVLTTMYGLYCREPESLSCFHKLKSDELWTFFEGDPIHLYLLLENGETQLVVLGADPEKGERRQFVIPRGTLQGGCLADGGEYALYGCAVAPGFTPDCFEAATEAELLPKYPQMKEIIHKLSVNGTQKFF